MEENANKLHFNCTDFNSSTRVTVYAECINVFIKILFSSLNTMMIININTAVTSAVTSAVTNFWCQKVVAKVSN